MVQLSALLGQGVDAFWAAVSQFRSLQTASGRLGARREGQVIFYSLLDPKVAEMIELLCRLFGTSAKDRG